jgi:hypothetical protein
VGDAPGLGAASLFHRNLADFWPDFDGRDLESREPGIEKLDLCVDGATIGHTAAFQLPRVPPHVRERARVVTITAGGNDLLAGLYHGPAPGRPRSVSAGSRSATGSSSCGKPLANPAILQPTPGLCFGGPVVFSGAFRICLCHFAASSSAPAPGGVASTLP